jgi:hypothetical protein
MNTQDTTEIKFTNNGKGLFTAQIITDGIGEMNYGRRKFVMNAQFGQLPTGQWIARALPITRLGSEIRVTENLADESSARKAALDCAAKLVNQVAELTTYLSK